MNTVPHKRLRVAILRSSRFLPLAIDASRTRWPGADVRVVYQPGAEHEWLSHGVAPDSALLYNESPSLTPLPFSRSRARRALRQWKPDVVVLQWSTPDGRGHWCLGLAALLVRLRGFEAITMTGAWTSNNVLDAVFAPAHWDLPFMERLARRVRAVAILAATAFLNALVTPAWIVHRTLEAHRMRQRHSGIR